LASGDLLALIYWHVHQQCNTRLASGDLMVSGNLLAYGDLLALVYWHVHQQCNKSLASGH